MAVGTTVTSTLPPRPPLASALAMDSPPMVRTLAPPPTPAVTLETLPPLPETAWAVPPSPPLPPTACTLVTLVAAPVLPDTAVDWELAPVLATEMAPPTALASPVEPELPDDELRPLVAPVEPEPPEAALGAE